MKQLLVVGDCMLDRYWDGSVDRISPEAPVPVFQYRAGTNYLGGALNVASNLKSMGAEVAVLGVKGIDEAGTIVSDRLASLGIDDLLISSECTPTTIKLRIRSQGQQILRLDTESPVDDGSVDKLVETFARVVNRFSGVIFSDYNKGCLRSISHLISVARSFGLPIFVDPKGSDFEKYRGCTFLTPNTRELELAIGCWKTQDELYQKCLNFIRLRNIENLVLTQGEDGMTLFRQNRWPYVKYLSAEARNVYDVTGAGDTVISVIAMLTCFGMDPVTAVTASNTAAGRVVGRLGTACITRNELLDIVRPIDSFKANALSA